MHPAPSIIFFTTLTGAGYGLLAWLGAIGPALPLEPLTRISALGVAFILIGGGLLCSTGHLQHPMRAWRGLTQWRSSWLSREAVLALLTFAPASLFAWGWGIQGERSGLWWLAGAASAVLSLATVFCTAMIYAALKPVRQWRHPFVVPVYVLFALGSGAVWGAGVFAATAGSGASPGMMFVAPILLLAVAWGAKASVWLTAGAAGGGVQTPDARTATGLTGFQQVRELFPPHTEETWLLREMAWKVGRKHARRLRIIAFVTGLVVPGFLLATGAGVGAGGAAVLGVAAAVAMQLGVTIERWLFFAEATHTVTLYYGAESA